jgi:hypothetical protein
MNDYLKYFVGKACTVTTIQINFRFKEEQMMDYFMGIIDEITPLGIIMTHPVTKCKNIIFFPHVVSISEEQVLYENNPDDAKIIEQYRKEKPLTASKTLVHPQLGKQFVNPTALNEIARKAKESFTASAKT